METTIERTIFTPAQVEVLNAVAHLHTEEEIRLDQSDPGALRIAVIAIRFLGQ